MQKLEKNFYQRVTGAKNVLFWVQNIKVPFQIGHHATYISNLVYMCAGGLRGHNLQTELNYLDSFNTYCNFSDFGFLSSPGGAGGWVYLRQTSIDYMSSGLFRGKESSNRIEIF